MRFSNLAATTRTVDANYGAGFNGLSGVALGYAANGNTVNYGWRSGASGDYESVLNAGNVGIGTTSPTTFKLQVKGDVGPDANNTYVLGSASLAWGCLYYNASVLGTCPSDQRLKDNIADLSFGTDPLAQIAGLRLRTFSYKSAPGSTYSGLVAQEVETVAPELVVTDASTTMKSVKYGDIQWLMLAALQKLIAKVTELADTVASFADHFTTKELTFTRATGDELHVNKLCVGSVCVTEAQFMQVFGVNSASQSVAASAMTQLSSSTPPVITIAGNNTARINIGDTYQDLGATAKDSEGHDLGLKTFLNGALVSDIVLDTSTTATDTIDYVATDQNGLTSTSTRTVFIEAIAPSTP